MKFKLGLQEIQIKDIKMTSMNRTEFQRLHTHPSGRDKLEESITEKGILNPIIVTTNRELIDGLHRITVWMKLGNKTISALIVEA